MKVLRLIKPIANKEHKCMFCGGIINKGEQYERQTNISDGSIYDWVSHRHCSILASKLDMYDDYDEGLDKDGFCERINDYVYDNHIDKTTDDVSKEWKLSLPELTKKIAKEDFKIEL